jgi:hypothetical protein
MNIGGAGILAGIYFLHEVRQQAIKLIFITKRFQMLQKTL